jgi:ParB family chromosome partitioning protein
MFLLKAQKYRQKMEGEILARKPALGRGLDALIPGGEFSTEMESEAVEAEIDIRSDIDIEPVPVAELAPEPVAELVEPQPSPQAGEGSPLEAVEGVEAEPVEPVAELTEPAAELTEPAAEVTESAAEVTEPAPESAEPVIEPVEPQPSPQAGEGSPVEPQPSPQAGEGSPLEGVEATEATVDDTAVLSNDFVVQLPVDRLVPNPGQPRKNFDETELQELADSIKEHGVIMPIIAADTGDEHYTIIAGERRTRAARLAGLADIPVIIRNYTDQKRMEISLIENIQRSDLNPIEEATAYKNLMDFSGLSHEEVAARVGKNRSTVTNALRLLKLSAEVQKSLETGDISAGHARALLSVTDDKLREKLFKEITAKGLSVREAEKKAAALNTAGEPGEETDGAFGGADGVAKEKAKRPPEITDMEEKFIEKLGTKVSINGGLDKGLIRIEYYSMEDLDRLYGLLS